ncbi:hypothetical protein WDZ92_07030 [Nostoc sp. NIES-2111]
MPLSRKSGPSDVVVKIEDIQKSSTGDLSAIKQGLWIVLLSHEIPAMPNVCGYGDIVGNFSRLSAALQIHAFAVSSLFAQSPAATEYIKAGGKLVAIERSGSVCQGLPSTLTFRNTGTDANGTVLTVNGTIDPNWKLISNPSNAGGPNFDQTRYTTAGGASTPTSAFIRQVSDANVPPGYYVYRQRLDLRCYDPASVVLAGHVNADDYVTIFVNGKAVTGELFSLTYDHPFTIQNSTYFVKGWNDIDFAVRNAGSANNFTAIRVTLTTKTATPTPGIQGEAMDLSSTSGNRSGGSSISVAADRPANWTVDGTHNGTWTPSSGSSTSYTANAPLTSFMVVSLKATSQANPATIAYKAIYFNPGGTNPVAISPAAPGSLAPYATLSLSSTVTGGSTNNVRWTVLSNAATSSSVGSFSTAANCASSTIYRAPSTVSVAGNVTIQAESCDNPAWKRTAVIPLSAGSSVSISAISPTPTSVTSNQQFSASVSNADNGGIQWSTTPTSPVSISASGLFQLNGYVGGVTVTARSTENTNISSSHSFNQPANQIITLQSFSTTSRTATVGLRVQDVPLPGNYSKISWLDLIYSPTSGQNSTPAGSTCRVRVTRTADPGGVFRIQVDDQNGGGNYTPFANFGSPDNVGSAGACRVAAAQTSGTASGGQWNLTIAFVGGGMSGMRYLRARSEPIAPSLSSGWVELSGANWNVPAPRVITMTNSKTTNPTIPSLTPAEALTLNMQSSAMYPGEVARIELVQANDGAIGYGTPSGGNVATATYTASNGGIARTIYFRAVIYENGTLQKIVDRMDGEYQVLVSTSADNPPTFQYNMPGTGTPSINPYPKDATFSANGTSSQVIEFGVDNVIAASLTGAYRIQQFDFHINRTFGESYVAQDAAGGCRLRITTGSSTHTFQLADDQGQYTLPSVTYNPSTFTGGTLSNSQCTAEIVGPASFVYSPTYYQNYLFVGVKFYFKPPFIGTRRLFMKANRIQGDWTGWQPRSTYTMQ